MNKTIALNSNNHRSNNFMVLFFKPDRSGSLLDKVMGWFVTTYTKCFGKPAPSRGTSSAEGPPLALDSRPFTHCAVVLDNWVYEVSLEGCSKYEFNETILFHPLVKAVFIIEGVCETEEQQERLEAAKFMLDQDFLNNRKLDVKACVSYLIGFWCVCLQEQLKFKRAKFKPTELLIDFSLKPGTMKLVSETQNEIKFHLPFTCASQAAFAITKLFDLDPILDSHLPSSLFFSLLWLARLGYGTMIVR